jgi:type IV pilus assembly protein PilY1
MEIRMSMTPRSPDHARPGWRSLVGALVWLGAATANAQVVSQNPLSVGGNVPGNMVLTPSVEFPTINSKSNINAPPAAVNSFLTTSTYTGYFDPLKCYSYVYNVLETERHFEPVRKTAAINTCSAASKEWSGNWLNWAATQTIDPFRKALTGGLRATGHDTATETWLEKARHDGQGGLGYFPMGTVAGSGTISQLIPSPNWASLSSRVVGAGSELYFTNTSNGTGAGALNNATLPAVSIAYDPSVHSLNNSGTNPGTIWRVSVRVKVCDSALGTAALESNCVAYGSNYKPEGLIQKYAGKIRFSVFGYLLDNGQYRDGGVLRASQKFVGPLKLDKATQAWVDNTAKEWDPATGVFAIDPNPTDSAATTAIVQAGVAVPLAAHNIKYSGVINYINKFGQLTGTSAKNFDPVSEMYYAATRYIRHMAPIDTYSDLTRRYDTTGGTAVAGGVGRFNLTDGFPVITNWTDPSRDPFEYSCQSTAILGIGDVYTHKDKNLKGNDLGTTNEPGTPAAVSADPMLNNPAWWTKRVMDLEGLAYNSPFSGRENSAYIAGLAYWAHTQDLRTDSTMTGSQTASTYWVDVREVQTLEPRIHNQYMLATKYGGFTVPDGYNSVTNTSTALPAAWWGTATDTVTSTAAPIETVQRPSNFYVADRASTMVDGLTRAFANAGAERAGSGSSLAANSTRLDTNTRTFQAQFRSGKWLGQLSSYPFNTTTGALSPTADWHAGEHMPAAASRLIYVNNPSGGTPAAKHKTFTWANLTATQKTALDTLGATILPATGTDVLDYLRGIQTKEESASGGTLRTRIAPSGWSPILGDIVNSTPVFVGSPNGALYDSPAPGFWAGKTTHKAFATANATRLPVVWVGGNDGMLHAFDASSVTANKGKEVYAFVPNASIMTGLANFADPDYVHRYFVDGDLAIADVYDTGTSTWKTVLVGTMGRGGPGVFALDVTNPSATAGATNVKFLWEKGVADIAGLGHNIGRPVIAQVADGDWRVVFGNGPDSAGGTAQLVTINMLTGTSNVVQVSTDTGNGLTAVLARDTNSDGFADTIYAGDMKGGVWKITNFLSGSGTVVKLFSATDGSSVAQPITAAPLVGRDPATGLIWVFVGTGKYLNEADQADTSVQSWYGFKDTNVEVARSDLIQRQVTAVGTSGDFTVRAITEAIDGDMAGKSGWYMNLPVSKERMVVQNRFQGESIVGTSRIPDSTDACLPTGRGFIMAINPFTGGRLKQTFFDTNRDGVFDDNDKLPSDGSTDTNGDGVVNEDDVNPIVSGLGTDSSANNPIFIENNMCFTKDDGTVDCVRTQGSNAEARRASWREITN